MAFGLTLKPKNWGDVGKLGLAATGPSAYFTRKRFRDIRKSNKSINDEINSESAAPFAAPEYQGITNPNGQLEQQYKTYGTGPASQYETMMAGSALTKGPSAYAQPLIEQSMAAEQEQLGSARQRMLSDIAEQQSSLATRGGLTSGARERLSTAGIGQLGLMSQRIRGAGTEQRLGITAEDEARKMGLQQRLSGIEEARKQQDIQRAIEDKMRRREFGMQKYQSQMDAWAAQQEARKQTSLYANKKSGLLGLGIGGIL